MGEYLFLYLSALFLAAYFVKLICQKIGIPEVTGYVIIGVLLGVSVLRFLTDPVLEELKSLSSIALGIISFIIGIEFKMPVIRKLGRPIFFIVLLESVGTFCAVFFSLNAIFPGALNTTLLLGAVAAATAPAATVAVIRQYKAKGPLSSTILAVVGIDDAFALIIYVFAASFVKASYSGASFQIWRILGSAGISLGISLVLGTVCSILYILILKKIRNNDWITLLLVAFIFGMIGLCELLSDSELLTIMTFGALLLNSSPVLSHKREQIVENFSPIFLAAFFILGGAHLDIKALGSVGLMGLAYFGLRTGGKYLGATLGAFLGRAPKVIKKYIGFSLLPQVGVALALALAIDKDFNVPGYGAKGTQMAYTIINILLFTTILTELIGPLLTKTAVAKAGETAENRETG